MQLLVEIKAPLNTFTSILSWAAKANEDHGHQFSLDNLPIRKKMIKNLFDRYNIMNSLRPKELSLYLPCFKRVVSIFL